MNKTLNLAVHMGIMFGLKAAIRTYHKHKLDGPTIIEEAFARLVERNAKAFDELEG